MGPGLPGWPYKNRKQIILPNKSLPYLCWLPHAPQRNTSSAVSILIKPVLYKHSSLYRGASILSLWFGLWRRLKNHSTTWVKCEWVWEASCTHTYCTQNGTQWTCSAHFELCNRNPLMLASTRLWGCLEKFACRLHRIQLHFLFLLW